MDRELRLKVIMAVMTPPVVIGCYLLLAGVYVFHLVTLVSGAVYDLVSGGILHSSGSHKPSASVSGSNIV
jgi:hypothetical protein